MSHGVLECDIVMLQSYIAYDVVINKYNLKGALFVLDYLSISI